MRFPVLQSFEKDTTKVNFTINQLSRGLDDTIASGEVSITAFPGIDLTGVTECAAAIQAAINSVNSAGSMSKTLTIPAGSILNIATALQIGNGTSSSLSTQQGVRIKGMGLPSIGGMASTPAATPVKIVWSGPAGGIMFRIAGPLVGWGLENLYFDGADIANLGIDVMSGQFGHCQNITIAGCRVIGIRLMTYANASFPNDGQANSMHNMFINTWINIPNIASAIGIFFTGLSPGGGIIPSNACYNSFINTTLWCVPPVLPAVAQSRFCLFFQFSDSNYLMNTQCVLGTNSAAVTWQYAALLGPVANYLDGIDTAGFGVQFQNSGTPGQFSRANYVRIFEANGASCPPLSNQICLSNSEQIIPWAIAGGIPDSLVLNYAQAFNTLNDGRLVFCRAIANNATAAPQFQLQDHGAASGFAAAVITKFGNKPLVAGDIQAGAELMLRWNATTGHWELLNPFNAP